MKRLLLGIALSAIATTAFAQNPPASSFAVQFAAPEVEGVRGVCDLALQGSFNVETKAKISSFCSGLLAKLAAAEDEAKKKPETPPTTTSPPATSKESPAFLDPALNARKPDGTCP